MAMSMDRLAHMSAVAFRAAAIGRDVYGLSVIECNELFVLGLLHDVGYRYGDGPGHAQLGGELLKDNGYKYWCEVMYHGVPDSSFNSVFLRILNQADMEVGPSGDVVSMDERLVDIGERYGFGSVEYLNAEKVINKIKEDLKELEAE